MAIYHCSIKIGSRGKGQSAVAASAYRSGSKLTDEETKIVYDYTRKSGIVYNEIMLCKNAPLKYANRETLWNEVHKIEKASNAQLWREIEIAIPQELNREEQIKSVKEYVNSLCEKGMCADWSLHDKEDGNPHAHIMLTMRSILENGEWAAKSRKIYDLDKNGNKIYQRTDKQGRKQYKSHKENYNNWNDKERAEEWRSAWADICNKYLSEEKKIDHRSYHRQKLELEPTVHEGYFARKIEKNGGISELCQQNREIKERNGLLNKISAQIADNETEIAKLKELSKSVPLDFSVLINARNEYVRQAGLLTTAETVTSVNRNIIGLSKQVEEATNNIVARTSYLHYLADEIDGCIPVIHKKKKAEFETTYNKAYYNLKFSFDTLVKNGVPEYQDGCQITPNNLTEKNAIEMVRLAKNYEIPRIKREEEIELVKIEKLKAAEGISSETLEHTIKDIADKCIKIPTEQRKQAFKALQDSNPKYKDYVFGNEFNKIMKYISEIFNKNIISEKVKEFKLIKIQINKEDYLKIENEINKLEKQGHAIRPILNKDNKNKIDIIFDKDIETEVKDIIKSHIKEQEQQNQSYELGGRGFSR